MVSRHVLRAAVTEVTVESAPVSRNYVYVLLLPWRQTAAAAVQTGRRGSRPCSHACAVFSFQDAKETYSNQVGARGSLRATSCLEEQQLPSRMDFSSSWRSASPHCCSGRGQTPGRTSTSSCSLTNSRERHERGNSRRLLTPLVIFCVSSAETAAQLLHVCLTALPGRLSIHKTPILNKICLKKRLKLRLQRLQQPSPWSRYRKNIFPSNTRLCTLTLIQTSAKTYMEAMRHGGGGIT